MTDDLTREHGRVLLACALLGGAHTARSLLDMVQDSYARRHQAGTGLVRPSPRSGRCDTGPIDT